MKISLPLIVEGEMIECCRESFIQIDRVLRFEPGASVTMSLKVEIITDRESQQDHGR
jgi:hypothetical protein